MSVHGLYNMQSSTSGFRLNALGTPLVRVELYIDQLLPHNNLRYGTAWKSKQHTLVRIYSNRLACRHMLPNIVTPFVRLFVRDVSTSSSSSFGPSAIILSRCHGPTNMPLGSAPSRTARNDSRFLP